MKSEWKKCGLGSLITFKNGKKRPETGAAFPVYGGNGVLGYADKWNNENCVVIGRVGAYCGSVFREKKQCWISDNAISGVSGNNNIDYLYYLLKSLQLNKRHIGTSQPLLTQEILNNIQVTIPPSAVQKEIASILLSLDEKIELNSKINDNLQQQAQALYKHYFPYSVGDELPDGWRIGLVGEIIEIHDSKRIPLSGAERAKMEKKTYPYYGAAALMDYVDDYIFDGKYLLLGEDGTVVDEAGYPILQYVWGQFWVNNHAHILTGKLGFNVESLYMLFKQTPVKAIVTGAVQPKISQTNLRSIQVVIPPPKLLTDYNSQIEPLFALLRTNEEANKSLTALRDTLLPKLMSGELDVSNIQL